MDGDGLCANVADALWEVEEDQGGGVALYFFFFAVPCARPSRPRSSDMQSQRTPWAALADAGHLRPRAARGP